MNQQMYVVTITAYDPAIEAERTLYGTTAASFTTRPTDTPPNTTFIPRVRQAGSFRRDCFSNGTTGGASRNSYGEVIFSNPDGALDGWLKYGYGRTFTIEVGPSGGAYPADFALVHTGVVEQPTAKFSEIAFVIRDNQTFFEKPIQPLHYAGDNALPNGVEGSADDIKGRVKPLIIGKVRNFKPTCVNTSKLIYQYSAGDYLPASVVVYDKAVNIPKAPAQANYNSQADMEARAPAAGTCLFWYEGGMYRAGSSPAGQMTVFTGDATTTMDLAIAVVVQAVYEGEMALDEALNVAFGGIAIDSDRSAASVLDEIAASAGAWWGFDRSNVFQFQQLKDPADGTSVAELNIGNILSIERNATRDTDKGVPIWQVKLGYNRNYTPMNAADIAGSVPDYARNAFITPYLYEVVSDASVLTQFPNAPVLSKDTLLVTSEGGHAYNEAVRLLNLYKVLRSRYDVRVKLTPELAQQIDLGKVVILKYPRFGLDAGKKFVILGVEPDLRRNIFNLTVWG